MRQVWVWAALCVAITAVRTPLLAQAPLRDAAPPKDRLRLSISSRLFQGMPEALVIAAMKPFEALLIAETGMAGDLIPAGDGEVVVQQLMEGKIQIAVMDGIEYAWLKPRFPQLRPLMTVVNGDVYPRACLVSRKVSGFASIADLRGKVIAEVSDDRLHCRLFIDRLAQQAGAANAGEFFSRIVTVTHGESGLDEVVDKQADAAIVPKVAFDAYQRRKPARAAQIEAIQSSEAFPPSVIIYRDGFLDATQLQRFQQGMLNANKSIMGRQLLTLWKLTAFAHVPGDYEDLAARILESYPAPKP